MVISAEIAEIAEIAPCERGRGSESEAEAESESESEAAAGDAGDRRRRAGLLAVGLVLALAGALLSRTLAAGVTKEQVVLEGPGDLRVPALRLRPAAPRGTALLVHGITASKETMLCLAEALAEAGLDCLCIDLPGHGRSPHGYERQRLRPAILMAARTLAPRGEVDLYVGHSLGGNIGQRCAEAGEVRPRAFVALGTFPGLAPGGRLERVLALTGRFDVLVPPARVRAEAARARVAPEVTISPLSDHLSEPFDPLLIARARALCPAPPATPSRAWLARALGLLLLGLAAFPLAAACVPRGRLGPAPAAAQGALAAGIALACALLGVGPAWVDLLPSARSLPWWLGLATAAGLGSALLAAAAAALARGRAAPVATCGHALLLVAAGALALLTTLAGPRFLGFLLALGCVALLAAGCFAWLVERRAGPVAACACFALLAAWVPSLWAPIFWG
ncbi:MAG: alpha/beta hydrolase [Planctomycetota bacterium]